MHKGFAWTVRGIMYGVLGSVFSDTSSVNVGIHVFLPLAAHMIIDHHMGTCQLILR